jgi:hypothetical protein
MRPISGLSVSNSGRDLRPLITFARSLQAASDWSVYHSILLCRPRRSSSTAMKLSGSGSNVPLPPIGNTVARVLWSFPDDA